MAENNNRPQGREKYVTHNSKGISRRGSGLNTGPVGGGQSRPGGQTPPNQPGNQTTRTTRGGGSRSPLGTIIILLVLLFGGGGVFGSNLLGGDSQSSDYESSYTYVTPTPRPTAQATPRPTAQATPRPTQSPQSASTAGGFNAYSTIQSPYASLVQGASSAGTAASSEQTADSSVAIGTRAKRTKLLGKGKDTVTVMVYMCGTDLESRSGMASKDLVEMANAKLGDNVHVIVYTGGCTRWNLQGISNSVNQIYEVRNGNMQRLVSDAGNVPMTRPATLTSFVQWCAENYPANRNMLIFWDHGGGSVSGYGYDQKYQSSGSMSLAGINQALKDAGVSFDFVGFDACLMATAETGLMLDKYADYMIASEETEPGIGWYYTNWLTSLSNNTSMPTVEIGKQIVDDFVSTCARQCQGQSATLSVVDLAELSSTVPEKMKDFSLSLSDMIANQQYTQVSTARNGTREFARSSAIDQIDLVHFARNLGTSEGEALAKALQGAVKYNRTSSNMTNAYGLSIYFPYRKTSSVDKAVSTYSAIGMDESYSQCIREFASMEASGQAVTGGINSPYTSLFGDSYSYSSSDEIDLLGALLGSFLGGDYSSVSGLNSGNTGFFTGRSLSTEDTVLYLSENRFDAASLVWTENAQGQQVISLPEEQWDLVMGLDLNAFYDDGEGYVDLGLDNVFSFDENGNLLAPDDRTWLAVDGQPVAYYHEYTQRDGDSLVISGRIPALLNGERMDLLVVFDAEHPHGTIVGARSAYVNGETETVAKDLDLEEIPEGTKIDFICDYYHYDGTYENTYILGQESTIYRPDLEISNTDVGDGPLSVTYRFTDVYQQHYWTPAIIR